MSMQGLEEAQTILGIGREVNDPDFLPCHGLTGAPVLCHLVPD
jgi:hypothetical protein